MFSDFKRQAYKLDLWHHKCWRPIFIQHSTNTHTLRIKTYKTLALADKNLLIYCNYSKYIQIPGSVFAKWVLNNAHMTPSDTKQTQTNKKNKKKHNMFVSKRSSHNILHQTAQKSFFKESVTARGPWQAPTISSIHVTLPKELNQQSPRWLGVQREVAMAEK